MTKTAKELAFLKDLSVAGEWTGRFTALADKHLKFPKEGKFLYYNAGTGAHLLAVREKLAREVELVAVSDDDETEKIAEAKTDAMKVKINFAKLADLRSEDFDYILADLSLTPPAEFAQTLDELVFLAKKGANVAFFGITAGSFGEIYSYLWETFLNLDLLDKAPEIERLIGRILTVSQTEAAAEEAGLKKLESAQSREVFEYAKSREFLESALAEGFLLPDWLDFLAAPEQKKTLAEFEKIVDNDLDGLSFRFSVKAILIEGEKA